MRTRESRGHRYRTREEAGPRIQTCPIYFELLCFPGEAKKIGQARKWFDLCSFKKQTQNLWESIRVNENKAWQISRLSLLPGMPLGPPGPVAGPDKR